MHLFTKTELATLVRQGSESATGNGTTPDHRPVVKLFAPRGGATWILTEYHPATDQLFGLCDLGQGSPELGFVSYNELLFHAGTGAIERDRSFKPAHPISLYAQAARIAGHVIEVGIPGWIATETRATAMRGEKTFGQV